MNLDWQRLSLASLNAMMVVGTGATAVWLWMNQSIYIHSHVETPYGVKRLDPALEGSTDRASYPGFERTTSELQTRISFLLHLLARPQTTRRSSHAVH